jgi:autoinducer 2-degrading protein
MLIVLVDVHVKSDQIEVFRAATIENARNSNMEPGIARFEVLQQQDDPIHFILVEVYRDSAAQASHKETQHYAIWRDTVAEMMAVPRSFVKYDNVYPIDSGWK